MTMLKQAHLHWSGTRISRVGRRYKRWCNDGRCVAQSMMRHLNRARQHQRLQTSSPFSDSSHPI